MAEASKDGINRKRDLGGRRPQSRGRLSSWSALAHLPKHLQTAIVSYRRQADQSADLDPAIRQFLDRIVETQTPESIMAKLVAFDRGQVELKAGTILSREWNGITQRAIVVEDGFLWEGTRYDSLSAIAFAITGTRWSGPRFFGLRDSTVGGEDGP
ncbi:hypothetical protein Nwi_2335 [Nitrobacter winogradskyi Nb-255]|uniref:Bacteriophage-related protein n=1 Tax=Nitrobacter winogradskyi (strain ATCC 25391 / DSM 10237 / CIP 104748 / NCIMB 11846 / Nb-255) TaxID=323098 RepID=Q3SQ52_NITWN|nr:DUF2924 domain-containing protein [Nitrobacter winogradskyi]ABA05589.1 hypothetical protein Nwi_2335 [Nitrobacter winogradskyi Nb-255]